MKKIERIYNFSNSSKRNQTTSGNYLLINANNFIVNTTSTNSKDSTYLRNHPNNVNILVSLNKSINKIEDPTLRKKVETFTGEFDNVLNSINKVSNYLPPFKVDIDEDSVFLEWVFKDYRIGFTIALNDEESLWFLVTNRNMEEFTVSGELRVENYAEKIAKLIIYALENS